MNSHQVLWVYFPICTVICSHTTPTQLFHFFSNNTPHLKNPLHILLQTFLQAGTAPLHPTPITDSRTRKFQSTPTRKEHKRHLSTTESESEALEQKELRNFINNFAIRSPPLSPSTAVEVDSTT